MSARALFVLAVSVALGLPGSAMAARIEGQVIHAAERERAAGLDVHLLGVSRDGETLTRETRTDADGNFAFDDLPGTSVYLLMADYANLRFPGGREIFGAGEDSATKKVAFHIYERSAEVEGLSIAQQRWFIERSEAGTYRIAQSVTVHNPRREVVMRSEDEGPALRVGVAPGHGDLQTRFGNLPEGATLHADEIWLYGPLFPGEHSIDFGYEVDTGGPDIATELSFPDGVTALELYILDVGVEIDAGPLHPARPARAPEGTYQKYLGFDLDPGTRIALNVRSIPDDGPPPVWPRAAAAVVLALTLAYGVGLPITRPSIDVQEEHESAEEREKQALFASLQDLAHDLETGKVDAGDYERLREELRRSTLMALESAREPQVEESPIEASEDPPVCACGRASGPGDRFCAECGQPL